ncbi:hypothetical protein CANINC_004953 [Pichia inconspicua]|uniref:Uncharacterized protein n=1 Tax=Pichia inconspicua TaxID=52247 RepID=A0A4V4NF16_9ASCO|nr:hypothetical protein CANINC_004953 [[Candida] inconspicua]
MQASPPLQEIPNRTSESSIASLLSTSSQSISPPPSRNNPRLRPHKRRSVPAPRSRSVSWASTGMASNQPNVETPLISVQFASRRVKDDSSHERDSAALNDIGSDYSNSFRQSHYNIDEVYSEDSDKDDKEYSSNCETMDDNRSLSDPIFAEVTELKQVMREENKRIVDILEQTCCAILRGMDHEPTIFGKTPPLKYESGYDKTELGKDWLLKPKEERKNTETETDSVLTLNSVGINHTLIEKNTGLKLNIDKSKSVENSANATDNHSGSLVISDYYMTDSDLEYFKGDEQSELKSAGEDDDDDGDDDDVEEDLVNDDDSESSGDSAVDDSLIDEEFGDSGDDLDSEDLGTDSESVTESYDDFDVQLLPNSRDKTEKEIPDIKEISFVPSRRRKSSSALQTTNVMNSMAEKEKEKEREKKEEMLKELFAKQDVDILPKPSKLSSLISTKQISLDYYKYVGKKQSSDDVLKSVTITIPSLGKKIECEINTSAKIVELIGYALWKAGDESSKGSNAWKCYLGDDGEIEDDFGVLDRTREIKSYGGADEFVLVECTESEITQNEKVTPSPIAQLEETGASTTDKSNTDTNTIGGVMDIVTGEISSTPVVGSPASLESDMTKQMNAQTLAVTRKVQKQKQLKSQNTIKKDLAKKRRPVPQSSVTPSLQTQRLMKMDTKLNLKKTRNTIQTILHNTADKYADTKKELFTGDHEGDEQGYYSWTVWRRQHMSFKTKLPKTLTIDGYQIYLLPFNEYKGSWYESKSYNFHISQVLKVSMNAKVPTYFKIVIKKNSEGVVKKYYLEAVNERECREIVGRIRKLAKSYK